MWWIGFIVFGFKREDVDFVVGVVYENCFDLVVR